MRVLYATFIAMLALGCHGDVLKFEQKKLLGSVVKGLKMHDEANELLHGVLGQLGADDESNKVTTDGEKPWFCHKLGCPDFEVIEDEKEYQLRRYGKTSWVSTTLTGVSLDTAMNKMFMKLFEYISGNNEKREKIEMTCPVIIRIIPGQGPACESNFTMSFFNIPNQTPPQPSDKDVTLTELPALEAYVRSFGGWADEKTYIKEAKALADSLEGTKAEYVTDFYYSGGYDAPFTIFNRHNEIWFISK